MKNLNLLFFLFSSFLDEKFEKVYKRTVNICSPQFVRSICRPNMLILSPVRSAVRFTIVRPLRHVFNARWRRSCELTREVTHSSFDIFVKKHEHNVKTEKFVDFLSLLSLGIFLSSPQKIMESKWTSFLMLCEALPRSMRFLSLSYEKQIAPLMKPIANFLKQGQEAVTKHFWIPFTSWFSYMFGKQNSSEDFEQSLEDNMGTRILNTMVYEDTPVENVLYQDQVLRSNQRPEKYANFVNKVKEKERKKSEMLQYIREEIRTDTRAFGLLVAGTLVSPSMGMMSPFYGLLFLNTFPSAFRLFFHHKTIL